MAPFIATTTFRLHPTFSRLCAYLHSKIHKLPATLLHKLPQSVVLSNLNARQFPVPVSFFHPDKMGPGPGPTIANNNGGDGVSAQPRQRFDTIPLNHSSVWAYLALAFVILAVTTAISYLVYSCYHSAGLRARLKPAMGVAANADEVKGGWQTLKDPHVSGGGEMGVEKGDGDGTVMKDREVGEKVGDHHKNGVINSWSGRRRSGLKGLGIQLQRNSKSQYDFTSHSNASFRVQLPRSSKSQYDFTSHSNESQVSIIPGSPHSACSDRSLRSTSDHEHEQDLESSEGSDCPSMSAQPLAHTADRSASYFPSHLPPPLPLPLPLPLPPPVTPSPQPVKQKRTRLRALTQILTHKLTQNQIGREAYFELQPMIAAENGLGESKGLSETQEESSPPSPSPLSSRSKFSPVEFAFFAPYPNCTSMSSNSTSILNSTDGSNSWGTSSCSPTTFPTTPITPLTPITPMMPVTPIKPGPTTAIAAAELHFDSNNIQFVEAPARHSDDSPGASPPGIQGAFAAHSVPPTRAEMLWNDPKLSPVQGAFGVVSSLGKEKTSMVMGVNGPTEIPSSSDGQNQSTFDSDRGSLPTHVSAGTLATPDQVHRRTVKTRLGYFRRGVSLSSPPSPSPSSRSSDSSSDYSATTSPSIATARFMLDREGLKRDNLRNRDRVELSKENGRDMKLLSPIPRPVFLPHPRFQG